MTRVTEAVTKAAASLIGTLMCMLIVFMLIGCGEPQTFEPRWVNMGTFQYRWDGPNVIHVQGPAGVLSINRWEEEGERQGVEWEWERDGDIDLEIAGRDYDIDSPWDFDDEEYEGYEDIGGGFIMVWLGGKLVKKPKTWLASNPKYNKVHTKTYTSAPKGYATSTTTKVTKTASGTTITSKTTVDSKGNKVVEVKKTSPAPTNRLATSTKTKTTTTTYRKTSTSSSKRRK